jgi:RNA polymerase sigma factor (sigma-70 family)
MLDEGSITRCLVALKGGDRDAAEALWARYSRRLAGLARKRLGAATRRMADEEDVALSAFDSVCRRAEKGLFPRLDGRDDLWRLLVVVTLRKAMALAKREQTPRRGGGQVRVGSELSQELLSQALARDPTPAVAAEAAEQCQHLLELLNDDALRLVALRRLEGHTNAEIARELGCVEPTVERKLQRIRKLWLNELES